MKRNDSRQRRYAMLTPTNIATVNAVNASASRKLKLAYVSGDMNWQTPKTSHADAVTPIRRHAKPRGVGPNFGLGCPSMRIIGPVNLRMTDLRSLGALVIGCVEFGKAVRMLVQQLDRRVLDQSFANESVDYFSACAAPEARPQQRLDQLGDGVAGGEGKAFAGHNGCSSMSECVWHPNVR